MASKLTTNRGKYGKRIYGMLLLTLTSIIRSGCLSSSFFLFFFNRRDASTTTVVIHMVNTKNPTTAVGDWRRVL